MKIKNSDNRLGKLKALAEILADEINQRPGARDLAGLSKQFRETIQEIEELDGNKEKDEINEILSHREANGKPGAVRKNRSAV